MFSFRLPAAGPVSLSICDVVGRFVCRLLNETMQAGEHSVHWNGRDGAGRLQPAEVYEAKLTAGAMSARGRVTVLR
ncbi:MAG: hypothetical protein KBD56_06800 [Candidatus Eisenbacteria bacterium]|nr:hypothetical protein [Candidatus Eisenbacteria bacterium]